MKKLFVIFLTVSFFVSCKKENEIQVYEPTFDNYNKVLRIIEVSTNQIVLKNNSGAPVFAQEYLYQTRDTIVRLSNTTTQIPHQATYTVEAAKPIDFRNDTVILKRVDFKTLDTIITDQFFPINEAGF